MKIAMKSCSGAMAEFVSRQRNATLGPATFNLAPSTPLFSKKLQTQELKAWARTYSLRHTRADMCATCFTLAVLMGRKIGMFYAVACELGFPTGRRFQLE